MVATTEKATPCYSEGILKREKKGVAYIAKLAGGGGGGIPTATKRHDLIGPQMALAYRLDAISQGPTKLSISRT